MRISILCTDESQNLIQRLLRDQPLATQATIARQAFELGLKSLASPNYVQPSPAEPPPGYPPCPDCGVWGGLANNWHRPDCARSHPPAAEHDLAILRHAHAAHHAAQDQHLQAQAANAEDARREDAILAATAPEPQPEQWVLELPVDDEPASELHTVSDPQPAQLIEVNPFDALDEERLETLTPSLTSAGDE